MKEGGGGGGGGGGEEEFFNHCREGVRYVSLASEATLFCIYNTLLEKSTAHVYHNRETHEQVRNPRTLVAFVTRAWLHELSKAEDAGNSSAH